MQDDHATPPTGNGWLMMAAILGGLAVTAGAFGAHGLEKLLEPRLLANFHTGAEYQMYHALALGLTALTARGRARTFAAWAFLIGILLFSGSLYALALTGIRKLGAITPIGGVAFLVGWAALAMTALAPPAKSTGAK